MKTHRLKTWPVVFESIVDRSKTFEFRKNDRDFKQGDLVVLEEWEPDNQKYTGRTETFTVGHVAQRAWGIPDGYCVFSLLPNPQACKTIASLTEEVILHKAALEKCSRLLNERLIGFDYVWNTQANGVIRVIKSFVEPPNPQPTQDPATAISRLYPSSARPVNPK